MPGRFSGGRERRTIFARAMLYATLYGLRRFGVVIAATARDSTRIMRHQKDELWSNELLSGRLPRNLLSLARHPERRPPGPPADLAGRADEYRLVAGPGDLRQHPAVQRWAASIHCDPRHYRAASRASTTARSDGTIIRPDFVLLDDVQTRNTAKSITAHRRPRPDDRRRRARPGRARRRPSPP